MRDMHDNREDIDEEERPVFIFPDDEPAQEDKNIKESDSAADGDNDQSVKLSFGRVGSVNRAETSDEPEKPEEDDGEEIGLSFGKVRAAKKEKEFVYMPFLNIEDEPDEPEEDDGEEIGLSFGKVRAAKKEKEFVYLPFLHESENTEDDESAYQRRRKQEEEDDIVLIPLPVEGSEYLVDRQESENSAQNEDGISVVGAEEGVPDFAMPPSRGQRPPQRGGKRRPPQQMRGQRPPSPPRSTRQLTPEQQFVQAMRNIDPEILAAVRNDPIQRAALEQAVRIALVQQAAQEAVAKTTGSLSLNIPGFQSMQTDPTSFEKKRPPQQRPPQRGARRPQRPPQKRGKGGSPMQPMQPMQLVEPSEPAQPVQPVDLIPVEIPAADSNSPAAVPINPAAPPKPAAKKPPEQKQPPKQRAASDRPAQDEAAQPAGAPKKDPPAAQPAQAAQGGAQKQPQQNQANKRIMSSSPAAIKAAMHGNAELSTPVSAGLQRFAKAAAASQKSENASRSGCLVWIIIAFIVFFVGIILWATIPSLQQENSYKDAVSLMAAGEYESALAEFENLGDYKDCQEQALECKYQQAAQLQLVGDYDDAISLYESIETYNDASVKLAECRYVYGKQLYSSGRYSDAYDQLYLIAKYEDAGSIAKDANYKYAQQLYEKGEQAFEANELSQALEYYSESLQRYKLFPNLDYEYSYSWWQYTQYRCAEASLELGTQSKSPEMLKQAADLFYELGDYREALINYGIAQYHYVKDTNGTAYDLGALKEGLQYLEVGAATKPELSAIVSDKLYIGSKLIGSWISGNYYFTYTIENGNIKLFFYLPNTSVNTYFTTSIHDNIITITVDGEDIDIMQIMEFNSDTVANPTTVTVKCLVDGSVLVFNKA